MVVEVLMEVVFRPVFEVILYVFGYLTAKVIFPIITLGYVTVTTADGILVVPKWHGINRGENGKIVLHAQTGASLGLIFWCVVVVLGFVVLAFVNN